jgi:hypothetical protein
VGVQVEGKVVKLTRILYSVPVDTSCKSPMYRFGTYGGANGSSFLEISDSVG